MTGHHRRSPSDELLLAALSSKPPAPRESLDTFATAGMSSDDDDDEEEMYGGWFPRTKSGKQRTPNQIRNELQKYIDTSNKTQSEVMSQLGVNSGSFYKFMNPGNYKNQWNATQNGTYWAAARFLEKERKRPKKKKANNNGNGRSNGSRDSEDAGEGKGKKERRKGGRG